MLRNLDPLLSPDLLHALASMGHGDSIVIGDANFPGASVGPPCIRADGSDAREILRAVLSILPLDTFADDPAVSMAVVGDPDTVPDAVADFQAIIDDIADHPAPVRRIERFAFYERAAEAFVIVQTGERRLYGNLILTKGVVT